MMIPLKNDFHSNLTTQISQTLRLALCQTLALSLFFSLVVHLGYSAIIFSLGGVDFFFFLSTDQKNLAPFSLLRMLG